MKKHITQFTTWLQGYLAVASTTAVTFLVAKAAEKGINVDAAWLQAVFIGAIGIGVVALERGLVTVADRVTSLSFFHTFVKALRFGQPLPTYDKP